MQPPAAAPSTAAASCCCRRAERQEACEGSPATGGPNPVLRLGLVARGLCPRSPVVWLVPDKHAVALLRRRLLQPRRQQVVPRHPRLPAAVCFQRAAIRRGPPAAGAKWAVPTKWSGSIRRRSSLRGPCLAPPTRKSKHLSPPSAQPMAAPGHPSPHPWQAIDRVAARQAIHSRSSQRQPSSNGVQPSGSSACRFKTDVGGEGSFFFFWTRQRATCRRLSSSTCHHDTPPPALQHPVPPQEHKQHGNNRCKVLCSAAPRRNALQFDAQIVEISGLVPERHDGQ